MTDGCKVHAMLLLFLVMGCMSGPPEPDLTGIEISPEMTRFEQHLFALDTLHLEDGLQTLTQQYPSFSDVFFYQIIADPRTKEEVTQVVKRFLGDTLVQDLASRVSDRFDDFDAYAEAFESALKYFKYYFPDKPVPDVYTCITGFEVGAFSIGNDILGVGLEFYLGPDYPHYDPNLFPSYIQQTMDSKYLVAKTMQALIANYLGEPTGTRLIDYMIRNGIELYIKQQILPDENEEIIHEFTAEQMAWLKGNEAQLWAFLLEQELLYSIEYRNFKKLITPSPNVPNMPPEVPGRVGNWVGFQIVSAYMQQHPDVTLKDLLLLEDAQEILAESKYKPRQTFVD